MLALTDLLSLIFTISLLVHIINPATQAYSLAEWYSHGELFMVNAPMSMSVFVVICITIDRFFSICRPIAFKTIHTKRYAWSGIAGSVALSIILWVPVCLIKTPKLIADCDDFDDFHIKGSDLWVACEINAAHSVWYQIYSWVRQTINSFIPIVILIVLNIMIIKQFKIVIQTRQDMRRDSILTVSSSNASGSPEDKTLIVLLISIMISFFVTMLPPGIFNSIFTILEVSDLNAEIFRAVANNLEILNHALNFYLYILLSKPIRRSIKQIVSSKLSRERSTDIQVSTVQQLLDGFCKFNISFISKRDQNDSNAELRNPNKNYGTTAQNPNDSKSNSRSTYLEVISEASTSDAEKRISSQSMQKLGESSENNEGNSIQNDQTPSSNSSFLNKWKLGMTNQSFMNTE